MIVRYEKGNFAVVPNIDEAMILTECGLKVYIALCKHADQYGGCFPSVETIKDFTMLSESGTKKGLRELRDKHFVEVTRRKRDNGSAASNHYQILIVTASQVGVTDVTQGGSRTEPPLTIPIEQPTNVGAKALAPKQQDQILKHFYLVLKMYGLPVVNHKHVPGWADKLRETHGQVVALAYLVRLQERDLRVERDKNEFVPTLNRPMDVLEKSAKIIAYFTRTKPVTTAQDHVSQQDEMVRKMHEAHRGDN